MHRRLLRIMTNDSAQKGHLLRCDFSCFCGDLIEILRPMSQHPSLKGKGAIKAKRSVLKRFERVELMKKRGQFKEGQRVIGLPKTKPEE
jgi:small basic protein (TIGR04137 family)